MAFVIRDQFSKTVQPMVGEGHGLPIVGVVDPEAAVLWFQAVEHTPQELFILTEDLGSSTDCEHVAWLGYIRRRNR